MALYELQRAQLGELKGTGYLFRKVGLASDSYGGVFFGPGDSTEELKALVEENAVTFVGTFYKKDRSGKVSAASVELPVDVMSCRAVGLGDRAILDAADPE